MKGWAIQLLNGTLADDQMNDVTPALFPTQRAAMSWKGRHIHNPRHGKVVKVKVTIKVV